jgi:uncharacterized metal-binding protein YceD (DUF177 family)
MRIRLHEITEHETELRFTEADPWLARAVSSLDEKHLGDRHKPFDKTGRPIHASLQLRNVDDVIVLNGSIDTQIQLICSRCANYFPLRAQKVFASLFCQDPEMAGVAHLKPGREGNLKPSGKNHGWARHEHSQDSERDEEATRAWLEQDDSEDDETGFNAGEAARADLDITYVAEDEIDLGDVVIEQLRLMIPFQPLCQKDCQGICTRCGADLNQGRCACSKIVKESPFSALAKLSIPLNPSKTPKKTSPSGGDSSS